MANEFIARKGLIALSDSQITGSLDVTGSLSITGISDVSASIAAAGGGGSDFPYTGSAIISGSLEVIGKVTGSVLIEGSGSTLFEVVGSEGQLFSITDSLSGSLFAVSDVSGLPILEVFSDDTVKIGSFNDEAITVSGSHTTIGGVLAIPGFTNVSASLAAAVAGGDNLGNHTATQDLNMGGNAITSVGNVDGVDVSALNTSVSTNTTNIATLTAATSSYSTATGVENNADVTDTANVTAAGALMDSEVTNLAQVKAFDSSDYATAAQGAKADTAIQPADTGSFLTTVDISSDTNLAAGTGITLTGDTLSTNDSEIDHDSLSNFNADEHFTQANITTVGTVTSGDVSAILPSGTVSGSSQVTIGSTTGTITSAKISDVDAFSQSGTYASLRAQGTTAGDVGLGNVTNESKATMFTSPTFTGNVNASNITGSDSAAIELSSYPIGYEALSSFPITGSGLIIRETGLPANNYPMLKIGDVELVDINSVVSPNVFFIHNVDSFLVASGSEPVNIFGDGPNKLFEHDGDAFKVYTKGIDAAKLTVESGSVTINSATLSVGGKLYNVANEATIEYIAGYTGLPNPSPTYDLSVQSVSSVIANTNREFDTGSSALASNGGSLGDIVKFGGSTTTAGGLYYLNSSGGWTLAQANTGGTSTGSLAVALGTNSTTDGMLLRGFTNPFGLSDAEIGAPVYVASASAGRFSGLPSQQTGEIVRVVGHAYGSDLVYFNPSNNWIEL